MDLKSFKKHYKKSKSSDHSRPATDCIKAKAQEYVGKSDEDLISDIVREAKKSKQNGSLSETQLNQFAESVAPMLNQEQRARLQSVLNIIKNS